MAQRHALLNRLQTLLLVAVLLAIAGTAGWLLLGEEGLWMALIACGLVLIVEPAAAEDRHWPGMPPTHNPRWRVGGIWR